MCSNKVGFAQIGWGHLYCRRKKIKCVSDNCEQKLERNIAIVALLLHLTSCFVCIDNDHTSVVDRFLNPTTTSHKINISNS
jgi:hypothetical protein